jgi:anthranilate synthase component 2
MMHGKTSEINVIKHNDIFKALPDNFRATRYHSLTINKDNLPDIIEVLAKSNDDNEIMAIKIKDLPIYGVQFHPESIMSEFGYEIIDNFLKL